MAGSKAKNINRIFVATVYCIVAFLLTYCFVSTKETGIIGEALVNILLNIFGSASYAIPVLFLVAGIKRFIVSVKLMPKLEFVSSLFIVILLSVFLQLFKISGGWAGIKLAPFLKEFFGLTIAIILVLLIILFLCVKLLRISIASILYGFWVSLIDDIKGWNDKKAEKEKPTIIQKNKKDTDEEKEPFEQVEKPRIIDSRQSNKKESNNDFVKEQIKIAQEEIKPKVEKNEKVEKIDTKTFKYVLPPVNLLREGALNTQINETELQERAEALRETLRSFKIDAVVQDIIPGPVITRYDIVLAPGVKIQSVTNIMDNISLAMKTAAIRIEQIPEKSAVGIEIPNPKASLVSLRDILDTDEFHNSKSLLALAIGTKTDGSGYISNLAKMPHLLIAGSTGSGKSVGVHNIILSILYKARPDEVKFLLIDPKRVEMTAYKDIPHLYNPCCMAEDADVITRPNEASEALKRLVKVMEDRYEKYAQNMVRNIEDYNNKMASEGQDKDYYIVVIIDELADLMMVASREIEDSIQRLAQMARAVGIHLILATQRPTVNVITGTIKANFPARLSFQTVSSVDSKVILDTVGAENLIGKGDMLFLPPSEPRPVRLQGAFVSSKEIEQVVKFIADQNFPKIYEPLEQNFSEGAIATAEDKAEKDLIPALKLILERRRISQDLLKANFGGSARATNILSFLEIRGFIHKPEGTNRWEINYNLIEEYLQQNG